MKNWFNKCCVDLLLWLTVVTFFIFCECKTQFFLQRGGIGRLNREIYRQGLKFLFLGFKIIIFSSLNCKICPVRQVFPLSIIQNPLPKEFFQKHVILLLEPHPLTEHFRFSPKYSTLKDFFNILKTSKRLLWVTGGNVMGYRKEC